MTPEEETKVRARVSALLLKFGTQEAADMLELSRALVLSLASGARVHEGSLMRAKAGLSKLDKGG